jgi:hypothetical protein
MEKLPLQPADLHRNRSVASGFFNRGADPEKSPFADARA